MDCRVFSRTSHTSRYLAGPSLRAIYGGKCNTVTTGRTLAENLEQIEPRNCGEPAIQPLEGAIGTVPKDAELAGEANSWVPSVPDGQSGEFWTYAQTVGSVGDGAVPHLAGSKEVRCYANS